MQFVLKISILNSECTGVGTGRGVGGGGGGGGVWPPLPPPQIF